LEDAGTRSDSLHWVHLSDLQVEKALTDKKHLKIRLSTAPEGEVKVE
jgi:hypothetical protein